MAEPSAKSEIYVSASPHFSLGRTTQSIMLSVIIAQLPLCIYGVYLFGIRALITILVSVASCVCFEALFQRFINKTIKISNLSAVVTGLMLALVLPPATAWWQIVLGAFFAVIVAKEFFGGIGANVFNPALTGRAFLFVSFSAAMGARWINPGVDAISSATTLAKYEAGEIVPTMQDVFDFFIGNRAGCIGETCALLIILAFIFLWVIDVIDWKAPSTMILTSAIAAFICSMVKGHGLSQSCIDTLYYLLSGGIMFAAVFMVTDYATVPVTGCGRYIFGAGAAIITFLIRTFGGYPEGVMFSILIMNAISPFLPYIRHRRYGHGDKYTHTPVKTKAGGR